jgi:ESF2/ABP1 family protein
MKPAKIRQLLAPFGTVGRVFLQPEDPASYARRKRFGGNKKRSFEDGWVEFKDRKVAKLVAETLNAETIGRVFLPVYGILNLGAFANLKYLPIGGKKGSYYHDDVWNIKYLKGFKWHHLTEQIANENAARASRLRAEISRTNKENKLFIQSVERAKMLENMEAKKKAKKADEGGGPVEPEATSKNRKGAADRKGFERGFKQKEVKSKGNHTKNDQVKGQSDDVKRVLSKIF